MDNKLYLDLETQTMSHNFNKTNFNQQLPEDKANNRVINNKFNLKSKNNRIVYD